MFINFQNSQQIIDKMEKLDQFEIRTTMIYRIMQHIQSKWQESFVYSLFYDL